MLEKQFPSSSDPSKFYVAKILDDGTKHCTCSGFSFRKTCKHTEELQKTAPAPKAETPKEPQAKYLFQRVINHSKKIIAKKLEETNAGNSP